MTTPTRSIARLLVIASVAAIAPTAAAGWVPGAKLTTFPSITLGERFGYCNATNGEYLAVGAPDARNAGLVTGSVYVFKRVGDAWSPMQKLKPPTSEGSVSFAQFGCSVAMSRDTLVIGSWGFPGPEGEGFAGAVFVYTRDAKADNWVLSARVVANDAQQIDQFGWSVSVDMPETGDGVLAVGKILDGADNKGAAYVFHGSGATWTQAAKLAPADLGASDQFGSSISVRGDTLVVGTQRQNNGGANAGAAYVFTRSGDSWSQAAKLVPADVAAGDAFGASVSVGDGVLAVGSPGRASGSVTGVGLAYIFEGSGASWTPTVVQQRNPFQNDAFGYSVAVIRPDKPGLDPMVIVGAPGYDSGLVNNGAAFAFRKVADAWVLDDTDLFVATAATNGSLGRSVSLSPDGVRAVLSSETPAGSSGAAYGLDFLAEGGGESPGSGGTPGDGGGQIPGGGVPPTGVDPGTGGGGGGGGGGGTPDPGTPGSPTPLPALEASFGTVLGSLIMVDPLSRKVMLMQTNGVHENDVPKVEILTDFPEGYELVAAPDLNGDGSGDLLFREASRGVLHGWLRDGLGITARNELGEVPDGLDYTAFGDFNGDGIDDLLLRDPTTGDLELWIMNNAGTVFSLISVDANDNNWMPLQVDIDGDGHPNLMMRQPVSGELVQLSVNLDGDVTVVKWPDANSDYILCAGADVDGDGSVDLLWKNESQGQYEVWLLDANRLELKRFRFILDADTWSIEKMHDFDGNGKADFLMSRNRTGRLVVVYMDFENGPKIMKSRRFTTIDADVEIIDFANR